MCCYILRVLSILFRERTFYWQTDMSRGCNCTVCVCFQIFVLCSWENVQVLDYLVCLFLGVNSCISPQGSTVESYFMGAILVPFQKINKSVNGYCTWLKYSVYIYMKHYIKKPFMLWSLWPPMWICDCGKRRLCLRWWPLVPLPCTTGLCCSYMHLTCKAIILCIHIMNYINYNMSFFVEYDKHTMLRYPALWLIWYKKKSCILYYNMGCIIY